MNKWIERFEIYCTLLNLDARQFNPQDTGEATH